MTSDKIKVAITADCRDSKENMILFEHLILKMLSDMPNIDFQILTEYHPEILPSQIIGFDAIFTLTPKWTKQSVAGNDNLIFVGRFGAGYDNIDVTALTESNILLCTTPKGVRRPMATAMLTLLLALSSGLVRKDKLTREGRWIDAGFVGEGLTRKTLGLLGIGNIGSEFLRLAKPFDMLYIAYDPYVEQKKVVDLDVRLVDFYTLLEESDYLCISAPLTEETYHIIGAKELAKMKRTAYLINTARGSLVDEKSLIHALQEGIICGAGIDVFEQEPVAPNNPLLKLDNVIVTPHGIGKTDEAYSTIWSEMCRHLTQLVSGEVPDDLVNQQVLQKPGFQAKFKAFLSKIT